MTTHAAPSLRVRSTDPGTSRDAALAAVKASQRAVSLCRDIFADGVARTDEQLHAACVLRLLANDERAWRDGVTRHARLYLSRQGALVECGTAPMASGSKGTLWRCA